MIDAKFDVISMRYISIMKAVLIQQGGKENQRLYCRSTRRKVVKSPFKIRQKIKELEEKAYQQEKRATLSKEKTTKRTTQHLPSPKIMAMNTQQTTRAPLQYLERERLTWHSANKANHHPINELHQKSPARMDSRVLKTSKSPLNKPLSPPNRQKVALHKTSSRTQTSQNEQLTLLKEENQRYKRIHSHSREKTQQLQAKLEAIRQMNAEQTWRLEGKMQVLKQRIEEKKISLGHLYTHTQQDYLFIQDCIITETENENSSILENFSKRFQQPSSLSIESK